MKEYRADEYFDMARLLTLVQANIRISVTRGNTTANANDVEMLDLKKNLEHVKSDADALNMNMVSILCKNIIMHFLDKDATVDLESVLTKLGEVADRVRDTLCLHKFLFIDEQDCRYYERNQFSPDMVAMFLECEFDMTMAGKSFALELFPGSVFHLMRVVDAILKRLIKQFKLKPRSNNWGDMLAVLEEKAKSYNKKSGKLAVEKKRQWTEICENVRNIKNSTRNPLSHSDDSFPIDSLNRIELKYTRNEALRVFLNVQALCAEIFCLLPNKKKGK